MSGTFLTLEGGDGAGKSTQAELLQRWLEDQGREVVRTREPGGTALGREIRQLLLHRRSEAASSEDTRAPELCGTIDPRTEALLFAADRAQHIAEVVRPALERGAVVVQDRYIDSSLAYQGAGRPLDVADVRGLSEWATESLWPDLTVLLDIDPEVAVGRRAQREGGDDRMESEARDFHTRVREGFLGIAAADPDRFLVLDATLPPETLQEAIRARLARLIS